MAGWTTTQQNLTGDGEPVRVDVGLVTASSFDVLGTTPILGRGITPAGVSSSMTSRSKKAWTASSESSAGRCQRWRR